MEALRNSKRKNYHIPPENAHTKYTFESQSPHVHVRFAQPRPQPFLSWRPPACQTPMPLAYQKLVDALAQRLAQQRVPNT